MVPASFLVIIRVVYFLNIPTYLRKQLLTQKEEKMIEIKGAFNTAKVFTDMVEPEAMSQIFNICCQKAFEGSKIRIMPDVHAGKGCVIGTTMTITDKVVPNLVGVDIGCGMLVANIGKTDVDFQKLDDLIRKEIPSGFSIRNRAHSLVKKAELSELACAESIDLNRAMLSIGTLGGVIFWKPTEMMMEMCISLFIPVPATSGPKWLLFIRKKPLSSFPDSMGKKPRKR